MNFRKISKQLVITSVIALYTVNTLGATQAETVQEQTVRVSVADVATNHWAYKDIPI